MGGSATDVSGHGLVLALHLLKQLNSPRAFAQMLQDDRSTLVMNFSCVKPLQHLIQVNIYLVSRGGYSELPTVRMVGEQTVCCKYCRQAEI